MMNFFTAKYEITVLLKYSCHFACAGDLQKVLDTNLPEYKNHVFYCVYIEDKFVPNSPQNKELCQVIMGLATDFNIFRRVKIVKSRQSNSTASVCFELGKAVETSDNVVLICTPDEKGNFDEIVREHKNVRVITCKVLEDDDPCENTSNDQSSRRTDKEMEENKTEEQKYQEESRNLLTQDHSIAGADKDDAR
jgi:hypothetical protein